MVVCVRLMVVCVLAALVSLPAFGQAVNIKPDAVVDLATASGAQCVGAQWRACEASIVADPGGTSGVLRLSPRGDELDKARWMPIEPEELKVRRGAGGVCFAWYDLEFTIPGRVGELDTTGAAVVLEVVVDDYAEIWVDGRLSVALGQRGGGVPSGFNAPNRVRLIESAHPGDRVKVSILGANGPISISPDNRVWVRAASLEFYAPGRLERFERLPLTVDRRDARLDELLSEGARVERLATGFEFTEGPVWVDARYGAAGGREGPRGYLLFSDPNANTIYRFDESGSDDPVTVFRSKSGYAGIDIGEYRQPGSNGLALDAQGRLTICQHGERRVVRVEHNGDITVLADRYLGRRLNSPNDLVYRSDGALFFTDPPFGLPKFADDPRKELAHSGVYCLKDGILTLVSTDFTGPNGLAFSPDEKTLYVGDWDDHHKVVSRYRESGNGTLAPEGTLVDLTGEAGMDAIDGVKVDVRGNVYVSGPGGLWIVAPEGKILGRLSFAEHAHNMAFGDADSKSLYLAAQTSVYRLRLRVPGIRAGAPRDSSGR